MTIEDVSAGETYDLEYYGWVATTDKQDGWTEIPIKHKEVKQNIPGMCSLSTGLVYFICLN